MTVIKSGIPAPKEIVETMRMAGVRAELVYAFLKTGLFPTEQNMHLCSDADIEEFECACMEYLERQASYVKLLEAADELSPTNKAFGLAPNCTTFHNDEAEAQAVYKGLLVARSLYSKFANVRFEQLNKMREGHEVHAVVLWNELRLQ